MSNYIIYDKEKIVNNEHDVAVKLNLYFGHIASNLVIADNESYHTGGVDLSDPVNMAINKYSNHPSIMLLKQIV